MNYNIASDVGSGPYVSPQSPVSNHVPTMQQEKSLTLSTETLTNEEVWNNDNEQLGVIQDFMLDTGSGRVVYAVLSAGGFLGLGNRLFAVPWRALTLDTDQHRFILDVAADRLKQAPGYDKNDWPDMADSNWATSVHDFYGTDGGAPYS